MDETCIARGCARCKETVALASAWESEVNKCLLHDALATAATHHNVELIACAASDPDIQKLMPQVLVVKQKLGSLNILWIWLTRCCQKKSYCRRQKL